ncbi:MAG: BON domain-containing protein [Methylomicrobium sp.]
MNINKILMMIFLSFFLVLTGCQKDGSDNKPGQTPTPRTERTDIGTTPPGSSTTAPGSVTDPTRSGSTGAGSGMGTSPSPGTSPGDTGTSIEKAGEYMDDSVITAKIKQDILSDPLLKSTQIDVTTENGVVKLSGAVDSQQTIDRVKAIAQSVTDVKAVESDLVVKEGSTK